MELNKKDVMTGSALHFDNEKWCEDNMSDDLRGGFLVWNERFNNFSLHFNGACLHVCKTFKSAEKRLKKLMDDWNCQFCES